MINYTKVLRKNLINVLKDILKDVKKNGLINSQHLYIAFKTNHHKVILPDWLKKKFPKEMSIVIQYEYWNLEIYKNSFDIELSFNNKIAKLIIPFDSIIFFADPSTKFSLKLDIEKLEKKENTKSIVATKEKKTKNNIIEFKSFKKY